MKTLIKCLCYSLLFILSLESCKKKTIEPVVKEDPKSFSDDQTYKIIHAKVVSTSVTGLTSAKVSTVPVVTKSTSFSGTSGEKRFDGIDAVFIRDAAFQTVGANNEFWVTNDYRRTEEDQPRPLKAFVSKKLSASKALEGVLVSKIVPLRLGDPNSSFYIMVTLLYPAQGGRVGYDAQGGRLGTVRELTKEEARKFYLSAGYGYDPSTGLYSFPK